MSEIKRAIILAGGEGTRLRPVTLEIPKPLVSVQGEPILSWLVRLLAKHQILRVSVIYPTEWEKKFEAWASAPHPIPVELLEERERMGTLGYLVHELETDDEPMLVVNGDVLNGLDLSRLMSFHANLAAVRPAYAASLALTPVPNPSEYGVAEMKGSLIARFHEKPAEPPSNLINAGLYVLGSSVIQEVPRHSRHLMFETDLFPRLAAQGRLGGCALAGQWYDCGTLERWESAIREWRGL